MRDAKAIVDGMMNWMASNTRLGYLLPDAVEAVFYLCIIAYFAMMVSQQ